MLQVVRSRRLAILFALLGFLLPNVPWLFSVPRIPFGCGVRYGEGQCAGLALLSIVLAGVYAARGAPASGSKGYWRWVAAVGLGWALDALLWDGWVMC